jgi:hypothetical protein
MSKNNKAKKTLLSLIAYGSTKEAQDILFKNTGQKAIGYPDLEYKLAQFYANSPDKASLEKEFAEIHPHKDFILKYLSPKVEVDVEHDKDGDAVREVKLPVEGEETSSCDGSPSCSCNSKETQPMSGFVGSQPMMGGGHRNNDNMILGVLGLVAIVGLALSFKK